MCCTMRALPLGATRIVTGAPVIAGSAKLGAPKLKHITAESSERRKCPHPFRGTNRLRISLAGLRAAK
jgi:hypothetical protein